MNIGKQVSTLLNVHVSTWEIYAGVSVVAILGAAYVCRHKIIKGLKDHRHEALHRNFFDAFIPLKTKGEEKIYPFFKWQDCILGGRKLKRAYLEIKGLYVPNAEAVSVKLDQWSTEFGVFFSRVERGDKPGIYRLWRSGFEFYPIVAPRDVHSQQSDKGNIALGVRENLAIFRIPFFSGSDSHTRVAAQSGWGKTYLLAWLMSEAIRTCPEVRVLLITSKGKGIIKKYVQRPVETLNPLVSLKQVHERIAHFHAEATERLKALEAREEEFDLSLKTLIVIDESSDVVTAKTTKAADETEALKQSISAMLSDFAGKMRSLGYHIVVSGQSSSLSDYPIGLRNNTHNLIVGQIDAAFYSTLFEGVPAELFKGQIRPGDYFVKTQFQLTSKVRVVHAGAYDVTSQEQTKKKAA